MLFFKVIINLYVQNKQSNPIPTAVGLNPVDTARSGASRPHSALESTLGRAIGI
jgi:hypothetical protein